MSTLDVHDPVHAHHEWWVRSGGYGTGRWSKRAFQAGVNWLTTQLAQWDTLDLPARIAELGKGSESIFYVLFHDDPHVWANCPNHGPITVTKEGVCDACRYEFV